MNAALERRRPARITFALLVCALLGASVIAAPQPATAKKGSSAAPRASFTAKDLMADVTTLTSKAFEGRRPGTPGHDKARAFIVERFQKIGLAPVGAGLELPFTFTRGGATERGTNIAALCPGSAAPAGDNGVMVISAHYDHLGIQNGAMHPGADDNASGVAVLLALARHCQRTPWTHDAVFVAFDAEEMGLQGARAFMAAPPIPRARMRLNINFDMVSRSAAREIYIAGAHHRPELKTTLTPVASRALVTVLFGHDQPSRRGASLDDWTMQSDHGVFHGAGIPFVYFGVEDHPDYHRPTDTASRINATFFHQVASMILDAVTTLDRALPKPQP